MVARTSCGSSLLRGSADSSLESQSLVHHEAKRPLDNTAMEDWAYVADTESHCLSVSREDSPGPTVGLSTAKNRILCSARVAVVLIAIAVIMTVCSVWLCLDMRMMLIREADHVREIKQMVENVYQSAASADFAHPGGFSKDTFDEFMENLAFDYDGSFGPPSKTKDHDPLAIDADYDDDSERKLKGTSQHQAGKSDTMTASLKSDDDGLPLSDRPFRTAQCDLMADSWKFDCHPEAGANEKACEARGCCWQLPLSDDHSLGVPYCFFPSTYPMYSYVNVSKSDTGVVAFLNLTSKSPYPEAVSLLRMDVLFETEHRLRVKIYDALNKRYEVPVPVVPIISKAAQETDYEINLLPDWGFYVARKSTGEILFDASVGAFIYCNQFIQLSALLPSTYLYGLGEQRSSFVNSFDWRRLTLFNVDHVPQENTNLYGSHPFYLLMEGGGQSHGVFLLNSNAMEIILQPTPAITYRTIGGILDFYFLLGPSPSEVISQYTELIGRPFMPPYWSLGFHLCRFNYGTVNHTREVWQRTREAGIPFDVQWNDIDYMVKRRDFTVDEKGFGDLTSLVQDIHSAGMHYIPILDCGIAVTEKSGDYPAYDDGVKMDVFIKDDSGKNFIGKVWPGDTVWPDFTNLKTSAYWAIQMERFYSQVPIDGAWIDMNEPSNFLSGTKGGCPASKWDNPPYLPAVTGNQLAHNTICMSARQNASLHYDVHNIYGFTETIATNLALASVRKRRPFVISRSTYPGQGRYGGHWTGDISSAWHDMGRSVADILNFNLFGIPMVGADICGFNGNTSAKLCQRWMELGAFYPFSRNHNTDDAISQDPVALGPDVVLASVKALYMRYELLPYLYTLFYRAHVYGETVARPLFFEFPKDRKTYTIETQFLWGSGLMVLPVLEEDTTIIHPYFPKGLWYLYPSMRVINSSGSNFEVESPLDTITVAARGGTIFPIQAVNQTTTASRFQMFGLVVALNASSEALGQLFWDDGDTIDTIENGTYNMAHFQVKQNALTSVVEKFEYQAENSMTLGRLIVFGLVTAPAHVTVDGKDWPFKFDNVKVLTVENLQVKMKNPLNIAWS